MACVKYCHSGPICMERLKYTTENTSRWFSGEPIIKSGSSRAREMCDEHPAFGRFVLDGVRNGGWVLPPPARCVNEARSLKSGPINLYFGVLSFCVVFHISSSKYRNCSFK